MSTLNRVFIASCAAVVALVAALAVIASAGRAAPAPERAALFVAAAAPIRVMPLGDSITRGQGDGGTTGTYNGYRCSLKNRLAAAGVTIDYVGPLSEGRGTCADREHAGWSGWTIAELNASAGAWVAANQPDVILLTAGTNDILEHASMTGMADRLGTLIDTVKTAAPGVVVIVGTLPQIGSSAYCCDADQLAAWNAFKAAVPAVAAEHGATTAYHDRVYKAELNADAIHPKACAYVSKMAFDWYFAWWQAMPRAGVTADPLWAPATCG